MKRFLSLIVLLALGAICNAQSLKVRGTISDSSDGSPLEGVVVLDDSGASAISAANGEYEISTRKGATLTFSLLGLSDEKRTVGDDAVINVAMKPDSRFIEDAIVVAYGTTTKESFTGSAEVVGGEKIKSRAVSDVSKALDGQAAGVMTTSGSGQPGSGSAIRIRGFGSINASQAPLIVVDGVPFDGELNSINSSDIESISILKDASAGALYGARGANGVILVTTTRAASKEDAMSVRFSARLGVNGRAIPFYETLSEKEYMELMYKTCYNDLLFVEGYTPSAASDGTVNRLKNMLLGTGCMYNPYNKDADSLFDSEGHIVPEARLKWSENWIKEAQAKLPLRQEYQTSVSGSSAKSRYNASLSYLNELGTLKTTGFTRYTARASADLSPKKWFDLGANLSYGYSRSDFLGSEGSSNNTNVWYSAMLMAPIYPVYMKNADGTDALDANGKRMFDYGSSRPAGAQNNRNSVGTLFDDDYYTLTDNLSARTYASFKFGNLNFTTNLGVDDINAYETTKFNIYSGNAAGTGRLTKENSRVFSYTWNQLLSYKFERGQHKADILAGHEFYNFNQRYLIGERTGFPFAEFDELGMGSTIAEGNSRSDNYAIDSWLSRLNWSYADRYYVSASLRTDASSRFIKENRWGAFWSLGASWRISEESFLKSQDWINNLTLKASYGVQGNDNLGDFYAWQSLYDMNYPNASASGAIINSIENKDITWEKNGNLNIGAEFRFFDRISGTLELFSRKTTDLLLQRPMPISLGFPGYYSNIGSIVNNGVDLTVGYDIFKRDDLYWNVTLMASTLHNRVTELTGGNDDIVNGVYLIRTGEEINTFFMARSAGIDPATGEQLYWAYKKDDSGKMIPGSEYRTNDSTVAAGCKYLLGSRIPLAYGSLSSSARFKGFDASLLLTWSVGGKVFDSVYWAMMEPSFVGQTYHKDALRAWQKAGDVCDVPRTTTSSTTIANDRYLVDASYLAVKNIMLGYTLPSKMLQKADISSLRVFVAADSPWILTARKGMDPQGSFSGSTSYTYTPNRTLSIGVDLQF